MANSYEEKLEIRKEYVRGLNVSDLWVILNLATKSIVVSRGESCFNTREKAVALTIGYDKLLVVPLPV